VHEARRALRHLDERREGRAGRVEVVRHLWLLLAPHGHERERFEGVRERLARREERVGATSPREALGGADEVWHEVVEDRIRDERL